jgi:hypothetical protein
MIQDGQKKHEHDNRDDHQYHEIKHRGHLSAAKMRRPFQSGPSIGMRRLAASESCGRPLQSKARCAFSFGRTRTFLAKFLF